MILRRTSSIKTTSITPYKHNRHTNVGTINSYYHDLRWQTEPQSSLNTSQRTSQVVLVVKILPARRHKRGSFHSCVGRPTARGKWHLLQGSCLKTHMDESSLVGCSPRAHKESDMTEQLNTHTLSLTHTHSLSHTHTHTHTLSLTYTRVNLSQHSINSIGNYQETN